MNNNFYKVMTIAICLAFSLPSISAGHKSDEHGHLHGNEAVASDWVTAGYTGKNESIDMVTINMAEDGKSVQGRYVGFGFNWDPRENEMRVGGVTADSPADGVLQVGDLFLEVEGIKVSPENFGKLPFRGLPGEKISTVIERDGKEKKISIARGTVRGELSKDQVLEKAIEVAQATALMGPDSIQRLKQGSIDLQLASGNLHGEEFYEERRKIVRAQMAETAGDHDRMEGMKAFVEKRKPSWSD